MPPSKGSTNHSSAQVMAKPAAPVFVVSAARSGSTLLRFILDAHPELACPPETNIPNLCAQLLNAWSLVYGGAAAPEMMNDDAEIPDGITRRIRGTIDAMMTYYLVRREKVRFCDKSLGTARYCALLSRAYPRAQFICLVRHPMDFIRSALDACPWGLNGYGFESYTTLSPTNQVVALARYWIDHTAAITAVANQYMRQSYLIRYEDLVDAPELVAAEVFAFLGVSPVPGIAQLCFASQHERVGPSDHKIWWTSSVSTASVGRGESVPLNLLPPAIQAEMNDVLEPLGYARIDSNWGTPSGPQDPRLKGTTPPGPEHRALLTGAREPHPAEVLRETLRARISKLDDGFRQRWPTSSGDKISLVSRVPLGTQESHVIDVAEGTLAVSDSADGCAWCLVGEPHSWQAVLSGQTLLPAAIRRGELRYCDAKDGRSPVLTEQRLAMIGDFLGLDMSRG
jgi:hypothetical protein